MGFSRQEYWSGVPLPSLISSLISPKFYIPCSFPNIKFVTPSMFSCLIWMKCIAQGIIVRQKAEETITQGCVYVACLIA